MALKLRKLGDGYKITTAAEAEQAVQMAVEIEDAIKEDLEDAKMLKSSAARWMASNHVRYIPTSKGRRATVIQRYDRTWDGKKLFKLLKKNYPKKYKKLWKEITNRVPDKDKINEAVKAGLIDPEKISDAFTEKAQSPYIQLFKENGNE